MLLPSPPTMSATASRTLTTFNDAELQSRADTTTTATDQDTDNYHFTDNGNADEVLKIATADGDANTLNAAYRDTVHDAFTDSDDLQDNWNGPDSADTGSDSGTDHSTDGDNGSETAYFHAQATLPDWQADSSSGDTPTWQVTSVGGTIDGTAAVNAGGDNGTDTDVETANTADSDKDHFNDTSAGTETFTTTLKGDGTTAILQSMCLITSLATSHPEDDNTARWFDPDTLDGLSGTDGGTEEVDTVTDDVADSTGTLPTIQVGQTESLAADGTTTVTDSSVDVADTETVHETDVGLDDQSAVVMAEQTSAGDE